MNRLIILMLIIFGISCEEKPVEIPEFETIQSERVVLLEELTGVSCPNCPDGTAAVEDILAVYPDNVIAVAIHGGFLSSPIDKDGIKSKYDFRNDAARDLENLLKPWLGKPAAYFNRVKFPETIESVGYGNITPGQWQGFVERELLKPSDFQLELTTTYNEESRQMGLEVNIVPLENMNGDYKISVMLLESHIMDPQLSQSEVIESYEHNHVLRDMLTTFDGDDLPDTFTIGNPVSRNYAFTLPNEDGLWVPENVQIVAFVSNAMDESLEVLQAAQTYLVK